MLATAPAFAQSAKELKAEGDAAFTARRYGDALKAYDKAYEAGHDAAVLYNKARAHEALEQFPEALAAADVAGSDTGGGVGARRARSSTRRRTVVAPSAPRTTSNIGLDFEGAG